MSETSPLGLLGPINKLVVGSCGVVVPNTECKIGEETTLTSLKCGQSLTHLTIFLLFFSSVDVSTGENLPPNKTGELCIRGPQIMKGYLDNDKATVETIKKGWLHSGDIAYHDPDGNIFIVDRLKELIKVKGFQVSIIHSTVSKRRSIV